ncbi:multidrug effflux MFS transporter [Chromobacterium sp. IIBBL 290-4]|uniref:multidrug effflux MFS transporter n=1 Tax=Chromobacterium sp. IIBBL 290-4 TaxID=2953890 RepID=UPI0020B88597|nr:multidrug effflux MFS transporter [Chromobacterium sp. IIBBL 290-4]UTH75326.1 multidrug effflux MFS transporter [Chromobacterium sp. IIBBL 290-4]
MSARHRNHLGLAFLLAALSTLGPFSIDTFLPAIRAIGDSLNASPLQMQQALTVYLFCYALMMLWHGAISDAIGRRPVVLATSLLFALASIGCALSQSLGSLLLFRALQGLCGGAGLVVGRAIIRDKLEGAAAQRLMSQVTMLFSLSPAIAPVIGGWLFGAFGWHSIFVFMGLIGLALFTLCWFGLEETHGPASRQPLHPRTLLSNYWKVSSQTEFQLLTAAVSFNFAGFFLYVPSAPVFLMQHLHLGPTQFLWLFGPAVSGIMFGAFLSGRMAGHFSARQIVSRGYWLMFIAAAWNLGYNLLAPQLALPWAVLPLALYTTGMSLAAPSITLILMDQFPHLRGTASSMQGFFQTMMSSLVAGALAPLVWSSPLRLSATMCLLLVLGFVCRSGYRLRLAAKAKAS